MRTPLNSYTCGEAYRRIDDYLDRELTMEEIGKVEEHLSFCEMCAQEFEFEASVIRAVRMKIQSIAVPPELRSRISQSLRSVGTS